MLGRYNQAIFAQVVRVIERIFHAPVSALLPSTRLTDDLALGRLGRWKLIIALEDIFDCEFPNDIVARFTTLGDIVRYISDHINPLPAQHACVTACPPPYRECAKY